MKHQIVVAAAGLLLLAGCGGSGSGELGAADIAGKLGCDSAKVTTKTQPNEPDRKERAACHGLTIVTFGETAKRDAYVSTTAAVNKAFGQDSAALVGDDWAVFGPRSKVKDAQETLGSGELAS